MKNKMIVEQKYWNNSYKNYKFRRLAPSDPTRLLIERYIPNAKNGETLFEIGCYPGRFLVELGKKGYIVYGCDLAPQINQLEDWCAANQCKIGRFYNASFTDFVNKKFNLVASFGFIEHFENFEEVFLQQCNMVKDDGILLVQYPNFRGILQYILHSFFDKDNLKNHVVRSMNLNFYKSILPKEFEIVYSGYYGNFDFWVDDFNMKNGRFKNKLLQILFKTRSVWKYIPSSSIWSPYAAIIARRKKL